MTQDGYLLRGLIFMVVFSIPTYGLVKTFGGIELDLNWMSYFVNVGTIFFAGVFSVGRANRYLLMTFVSIIMVSYAAILILDLVLPMSGYIRIHMYLAVSYMGYWMLIRRNVLTMKLNAVKNRSNSNYASQLLNAMFKRDLPTRETNMSLMMVTFAKIYIAVDLIFSLSSVIYYNYIGMDFYDMFGPLLATGNYLNIPFFRDTAILIIDVAMSICLVTNVLYDGRRPDTLGIGKHVVYDKVALNKLKAKS